MKLLIITQIVDKEDPALGFFHRWIEEFAKHAKTVHVICLYEGKHTLPENVHVHSLGKETRQSKIQYILRFYSYIWKLRKDYDAVFVHMNPEYVVLGGICWRLLGKKIGLWYTHKSVDLKLRVATMLSHHIFTASPESFRLKSKKLTVTGHGVNVDNGGVVNKRRSGTEHLLTASRISRIKNLHILIDALSLYRSRGYDAKLSLIGGPLTDDDKKYEEELKQQVREQNATDHVHFLGPMSNFEVVEHIQNVDVCLNASDTGSLDKFILEAMASRRIILTSNMGAQSLLGNYGMLFVPKAEPAVFADYLERIHALAEDEQKGIQDHFFQKVKTRHSLSKLIERIVLQIDIKK